MVDSLLPSPNGAADITGDGIALRELVPSHREQGLGVQVDKYDFVEPQLGEEPRKSLGEHVKNYFRSADPRLIEGPKLPLIIIGLISFNGAVDGAGLAILLPNMQASFGLDLSFLLVLNSILNIFTLLVGPIGGWLADRVKRVWMMRAGALLGSAGTIGTGLVGTVPALVGLRAVGGVSGAITGPAGIPLLTDYFPARARVRTFAFFGVMTALGAIVGPIVIGPIATSVGWRATYLGVGFSALAFSLLTFLMREPIRGYYDRLDAGATVEQASHEQAPMTFAEGFRASLSIQTLRRLWIAQIPAQIAARISVTVLPLYFADHFLLDPTQRGYIAALGAFVGLLGLLVAGPIGDRLLAVKPETIFAGYAALTLIGAGSTFIMAYAPWLWLAIAMSLPLGLITAATAPTFFALMALVVPARMRGQALQTGNWFALLGQLILLGLASWIGSLDLRHALLATVPFIVLGALGTVWAGGGFSRDMRAAQAASMADEEAARARAAGRNKMVICRDVDVTYDGVQVLFNVDFDVEEGEIIALLGTNGAGKSTLLRAIAGVQEASNGAILLDGRDITHAPPYENAARGVVMMPGGNAVFPTLSVAENLRTAAFMYRDDEAYVKARMEQVLEFFPVLQSRWDTPAGNLSGGEQQMVGLGQAFLMRPRLLMIDELSLGLAPRVVDQLLDILRTVHAQGTTIIIVEQSLNVALTIAERAVFMEKGEIRFSGPTPELLRRPDLIRAVFMGGGAAAHRAGGPARARRGYGEVPEPLLDLHGIDVRFGGLQALGDVDLTVMADEIVGIIGPNGAGKTTLFDVVSGFVPPDTGVVALFGEDVTKVGTAARGQMGLARSFQNARLFPALTVRENISVALERRAVKSATQALFWTGKQRRSERWISSRVDDLVGMLGLGAYAEKFLSDLSTGTRRAVDIACIMAAEPRLLLLDEPSSGLAQVEVEELAPVLQRVARDAGCGLLVIEHDLPLITSISDRLVAMELGRVVTSGSPAEVTSDQRVLSSYLAATEESMARSGSAMATIAEAVGVGAGAAGIEE
jgi:ABC-type branched-subunit amino acid transport system ATPase component/MFS family permease